MTIVEITGGMLRAARSLTGLSAAERWRSVKVTEFERRQMAAVRKELDEEYEASVGLDAQPSKDSAQPWRNLL